MLHIKKLTSIALLMSVLLNCSIAFAQKKKKEVPAGTPILWQEPTDISTRDLYLGPGGESMKPDLSRVTFVEEKTGGWSKKYEVKDAAGHRWIAKLGKEAQSDTAANRLLWAVGYVTEIAYLAPKVNIEGKGTLENVRFEARPENLKRVGDWKWTDNPFIGTKEFQGLKIMMMLINNWDIKDENNEIIVQRDGEAGTLNYIISDLGASLGKTGGIISRSRNKPEDFVKSKFIEKVSNGRVDFNYGGKNKEIFQDITVEQARWMGNLLARLSDQQIQDAFRSANYAPEEIADYTRAIKARISQLVNLQG